MVISQLVIYRSVHFIATNDTHVQPLEMRELCTITTPTQHLAFCFLPSFFMCVCSSSIKGTNKQEGFMFFVTTSRSLFLPCFRTIPFSILTSFFGVFIQVAWSQGKNFHPHATKKNLDDGEKPLFHGRHQALLFLLKI